MEKTFENGGHIQVYSPGAEADNPWGQIVFIDSINQSKKLSNDQELIQSDPISRPQKQKGNN